MPNWTEILLGLTLCVVLTRPCLAQSDNNGDRTPSTSVQGVESIRVAYIEGRDKDVLVMVERGLIDLSTAGDIENRAAEFYFWKGCALRRLGRFDEAVIALDHAKSLGYGGPELFLERGLANKTLGNSQEAQQDYQEAERRFPEDQAQQDLYLKHWKWDALEQPRFQIWLAPQAGWDSNVIGLDPQTPLEEGKVPFDSYYLGAYLDAKYFLLQNQHQNLWLEYQLMGREYPQDEDVSFLDNIISLAGRQPLYSYLDLEIRASFEEAFLRNTGEFRTQRTIGPAFLLHAATDVQVRVWGDWTDANYYESVPAPEKRSGNYSRAGITFAIDLGQSWMAGPYGVFNNQNTAGSDYDAKGWELGLQMTSPEYAGFKLIALVSYGEEDYSNPNSLTAFMNRRMDRPFTTALTMTFKQVEKWLGYAPTLSVGYVRHESNISDFNYTRWTPQFELSFGVLAF